MEDTIGAIATPPGEGGIGVIRVSGEQALQVTEKIFQGKKKTIFCDNLSLYITNYAFFIYLAFILFSTSLHSLKCKIALIAPNQTPITKQMHKERKVKSVRQSQPA